MSHRFDGANDWLGCETVPVVAPPFSMACWFNPDRVTHVEPLVGIYQSGGVSPNNSVHALQTLGTQAGDPLRAASYDGVASVFAAAVTTTGFTAGSWFHACGVWAATNDRRAFINGGSKGTNVTNVAPVDMVKTALARDYQTYLPHDYFDGFLAEAAIWNAALSDAEVAVLAAGYRPTFVRPQNLAAYWPLLRHTGALYLDRVGSYSLTVDGGSIQPHPPVLYPLAPMQGEAGPVSVFVGAPAKGWGWGWVGA